jgi:monovalent cation:H+ antiporter, CPA1 family
MTMSGIEGLIILMIAAAVVTVVARWIHLPFTLALLLLGLGLGAGPAIFAPTLNSEIILLLFLPPLLFEASFVLDLQRLWTVRKGVLAFAGPGVLLAMVVGGALVHWALDLPWSVALLFGATIAATDPVAVLATFRQLGVSQRLAVLLEGESLLNDGVALALLVALTHAVEAEFSLGGAGGTLLVSVVGGTVVGLALGWVGHFLIATIDEHLTEMTVSVAVAYGAFLTAETLHLSGVLATITAAMTLGYLGRARGWIFSGGSERLLADLWEFLAFVANAALFLLMGTTVHVAGLTQYPGAVLIGIAAALLGRGVVAYGVGAVLSRWDFPLSWPQRHVVFWGGLRGAVALAAALSLPAGFPHRAQLLAMTYGVVLFTLLAQGLTIGPLARRLGLTVESSRPNSASSTQVGVLAD